MTHPLLSCSDARIDADGSVLVDALTFDVDGARVGLVGEFGPVFRLLSRSATLSRGSVAVLGCPAVSAVATNHVGLASADPVLPEPWSVLEFLTASAALMGLSRRAGAQRGREALETVEAAALAKRRILTLSIVERRIMLIAHAIVGRPPAIFLESPLSRLSEEAATEVRRALELATQGRRLIVSVESPAGVGPELNLLAAMDRVVVMAGSTVVAVGAPGDALKPSPRCVVWAARRANALSTLLSERGFKVERAEGDGDDSGRLVVHLHDGASTTAIVDAALEVEAPLLELASVGLDPPG